MRSALYYPHTTVESFELIKTALLLWDKLEFIVPWQGFQPGYEDKTIARAMELIGAARCPNDDEKKETHERIEELVDRKLPPQFYFSPKGEAEPYEIYPEKLLPETSTLLRKSKLSGKLLSNNDIPMSEPGGLTIMSILADCCAGSTRSRITDRADAYATLSGFFSNGSAAPPLRKSDAHEHLLGLGLEAIDVKKLSLDKLIKFREREEKSADTSLRDLRHRYITSLETYASKLTAEKCSKADAEEIKRQYADDMKKDARNLRTELGFAKRDAIFSKDMIVTTVAGIGTAASWLFGVPISIAGAVTAAGAPATVGCLLGARNKYLSARYTTMQKHPMAYLYELRKAM